MDTTTFSVAATASELATKVRAWLGGQTTPDVAPAMYKLETTAATSEKYAVVLTAVYTVGPRRVDAGDDKISPAAGCEEPLLRRGRANDLLSPPAPAQISPAWSCPRHVRDLLHRHVRALAAGMSTEEMVTMGSASFVKEAIRRVNLDLAGGRGGVLVYGARVGWLGVEVPCDRMSVAAFAEEGAAAPAMAYTVHPVVKLLVVLTEGPGGALVSAAMGAAEPATVTEERAKVFAAGIVAADYHMERRGETTLRLKMKGQITNS